MTKRRAVLLAVLVAALAAGCSSSEAPADGTPLPGGDTATVSTAPDVEVGEENDGETVALSAGQTLLLRLTEIPGTGYQWRVEEFNEAFLTLDSDELIPPAEQRPGASYVREWRFKAGGTGSTTLKLLLFPPARDAEPEDEYTLTVVVSP